MPRTRRATDPTPRRRAPRRLPHAADILRHLLGAGGRPLAVLGDLAGGLRGERADAAEIVADVRARGDAAVVDYTRKFDWPELDAAKLRITDAERDEAAARGEQGTVALLCAVGMQTSRWSNIPPVTLYHVVAALKRVGLEPEARMIAAEALARV